MIYFSIFLVDCLWSKWGTWSTCSKSCGNGFSIRKRTKSTTPKNGGKECIGQSKSKRSCIRQQCPGIKKNYVCIAMNLKKFSFIFSVNCMWSSWGRWSSCSMSCGKGIRQRRRTITRNSKHGGKKCSGSKMIKQYCNTKKCSGMINLITSRTLILIQLYLIYLVLIYL